VQSESQASTPKNELGWQMWRVFAFLATTIIGHVHELLINSKKAVNFHNLVVGRATKDHKQKDLHF
jgi:hypothetical protein